VIRTQGLAVVILAPNAFNGPAGPGDLVFTDGNASTLDTDVAQVYIDAGFGAVDPAGVYNAEAERTRLRDAAVDPLPGDYKPPVGGVAPGLSRIGEVS
jgi:hypothetical protein